jgi:hypothetical protein
VLRVARQETTNGKTETKKKKREKKKKKKTVFFFIFLFLCVCIPVGCVGMWMCVFVVCAVWKLKRRIQSSERKSHG